MKIGKKNLDEKIDQKLEEKLTELEEKKAEFDEKISEVNKKISEKKGRLAVRIAGVIAGAMIIFSFFQTVLVVSRTRSQVEDLNTEHYEDILEGYSSVISKHLEEYIAHLDFYLNADVVKTQDTEQIVEWLRANQSKRYKEFDYVAWVDSKGDFYSDVGSKTNVLDRDYFQAIMKNGADLFIDNPVTSKTTGLTIIHVSKAVKVGGKNVGFFCAVLGIQKLAKLLEDINIGEKGIAVLYSGTGQLMSRIGAKDMLNVKLEDIETNRIGKAEGNVFWSNLSEYGKVLSISRVVPLTQWKMSIIIKNSAITEIADKIGYFLILFSVLLVVLVIITIFVVVYNSVKPLHKVEKAIREIATGNADLTRRIDVNSSNEIGRVVDCFNQFSDKLQSIMGAIKETKDGLVYAGQTLNNATSDTSASITEIIANIESMGTSISSQSNSVNQTASAVKQIAENIESLNNLIESQASAVTQASAAVEQMIGNISSVSNSVSKMANQFKDLEQKAIEGIQKQDDVSVKIELIESESEALQEANAVIANIAEQTNLLAMNAAIEAAHAGEAGKGFSVVADEIRKLSENSSSQSNSIGNQLKKIVDSISEMVAATEAARQSFTEVSVGINQTNDLVSEITNSMQEQSEGSRQISLALHAMNDSTADVRSSSFEMSEGNKAILAEMKKLQDETLSMKNGMDEMTVGATQINKTGSELSNIAEKMENSISKIGEQVDQFKV